MIKMFAQAVAAGLLAGVAAVAIFGLMVLGVNYSAPASAPVAEPPSNWSQVEPYRRSFGDVWEWRDARDGCRYLVHRDNGSPYRYVSLGRRCP